jgi:hypothetical protein
MAGGEQMAHSTHFDTPGKAKPRRNFSAQRSPSIIINEFHPNGLVRQFSWLRGVAAKNPHGWTKKNGDNNGKNETNNGDTPGKTSTNMSL